MARVGVDSFREAHRGQVPDGLLATRSYQVSERNWARTLAEVAASRSLGTAQECVYVAEDGECGVVGFAMGGPSRDGAERTGEVYTLYLIASHHRRGAGRRLMQCVALEAAERGWPRLVVQCLKANLPARAFYEALGGVVVGEVETEDEGFILEQVVYAYEVHGLTGVTA